MPARQWRGFSSPVPKNPSRLQRKSWLSNRVKWPLTFAIHYPSPKRWRELVPHNFAGVTATVWISQAGPRSRAYLSRRPTLFRRRLYPAAARHGGAAPPSRFRCSEAGTSAAISTTIRRGFSRRRLLTYGVTCCGLAVPGVGTFVSGALTDPARLAAVSAIRSPAICVPT